MPTPRIPREVSARSSSWSWWWWWRARDRGGRRDRRDGDRGGGRVRLGAAAKDAQPDRDHEQPGRQGQPGVELLGHDEREQERHEPEREHAGGVRDRHRRSERDRVAGVAARAHGVSGHEALPCPGVSACAAPHNRDEQREQDDPRRGGPPRSINASKPPPRWARPSWRRASGPAQGAAGREVRVRRADVERRAEQVARVGPELVERLSRGTDASTSRAPSRAETASHIQYASQRRGR